MSEHGVAEETSPPRWDTLRSLITGSGGDGSLEDPITTEEFLHRAAAHELDSHRGTTMLWLILDDRWKRRAVERISFLRLDTIDTKVEFHVDLGLIRRQGAPPDANGDYWLPLLFSPALTPAVLEVQDDRHNEVSRLTTTEARWYLCAALADLLVRSGRNMLPPSERRDVELLVTAVLRRWFEEELRGGTEVFSDRHRKPDDTTEKRASRRIERAIDGFDFLFSRPPRNGERRPPMPEQDHALRLIDALVGLKILFVRSPSDVSRMTFTATVPARAAKPVNPHEPELEDSRLARLAARVLREGPGPGRAQVDLDLIGFTSAPNYHVVVDLPEETQSAGAVLNVTWDCESSPVVDHANVALEALRKWQAGSEGEDVLAGGEVPEGGSIADRLVLGRSLATLRGDIADLQSLVTAKVTLADLAPGEEQPLSPEDVGLDTKSLRSLGFEIDELLQEPEFDGRAVGRERSRIAEERELIESISGGLGEISEKLRAEQPFEPLETAHPDRIHISVPASDRRPTGAVLANAQLTFKLWLSDPRPHTATNLVNRLNLMVLAAIGVLVTIASYWNESRIETSAVVAVMLLFTGILAARIERPGRTTVRGWLARTPYALGFFSTTPAVLASIVLVSGIWRLGPHWGHVIGLSITFTVVVAMQAGLLVVGIAANESAQYYERPREPDTGHVIAPPRSLIPPLGVLVVSVLRNVIPQGLRRAVWFEPVIRSSATDEDLTDPHANSLALLRTPELGNFVAEQLARQAAARPWRVLSLTMPDRGGKLLELLERTASAHLPSSDRVRRRRRLSPSAPAEGPAIDLAGALGVSFAGRSLVHLIASEDRPGALEAAARRSGIQLATSDDHSDIRGAPVRSYGRIYEFFIEVPHGIVNHAAAARRAKDLSQATKEGDLQLLMLHFPAVEPSWATSSDESTWIRARVGVSHSGEESFNDLVRVIAGFRSGAFSVASVSEFHRPSVDVGTGDVFFADPLASLGQDRQIGLLFAHAVDRIGLVWQLFEALDETHTLDDLLALSFTATSGLALFGGVLDSLGRHEELRSAIVKTFQSSIGAQPGEPKLFADPTAWAAVRPSTAWPRLQSRDPHSESVILQLTWNAPDRRGVLWTLLEALCRDGLRSERANLLYVLSRVSRVDMSVGRLMLRMEDLDVDHDDPSANSELKRVVQQVELRAEQALHDFVHRTAPAGSRRTIDADRDIFVTVDVMRQAPRPG